MLAIGVDTQETVLVVGFGCSGEAGTGIGSMLPGLGLLRLTNWLKRGSLGVLTVVDGEDEYAVRFWVQLLRS